MGKNPKEEKVFIIYFYSLRGWGYSDVMLLFIIINCNKIELHSVCVLGSDIPVKPDLSLRYLLIQYLNKINS